MADYRIKDRRRNLKEILEGKDEVQETEPETTNVPPPLSEEDQKKTKRTAFERMKAWWSGK